MVREPRTAPSALLSFTWHRPDDRSALVMRDAHWEDDTVMARRLSDDRYAGLAGILYSIVFSGDLVSPNQGDSLLIFAFIVVVIGGLGSIRGSAVAALVVGLLQQYTSFYIGGHSGWAQIGDLSTVLLLAGVLEWRPRGLFGRVA